ncbi:hypothetical protein HYW20_05415 [Candidatus Woesearchaeota archaeon]|nr:hypothetical protein [Candidatus Woesearchaeota archaeon]
MKRVLPDTNFYELMLKYLEVEKIRKVKESGAIVFYGIDIIRKELRATPKTKVEVVRNELFKLRSTLLLVYDLLIGRHQYGIDSKINQYADNYYIAYKVLKGKATREEIINDFRIVACATIHNIDILVSDDNKTMLSQESKKAYTSVNNIHKLTTPNFIGFEEFKRFLRGVKLD